MPPASLIPESLQLLLLEALDKSPDGLGIFNDDDTLVFCSSAFAALFAQTSESATGLKFADLIRHAHQSECGIHVETDDVEDWIEKAHRKRRSANYRTFELDTSDGRWFLMTEQVLDCGALFILATEITAKKRVEEKLQKLSRKLTVLANTDSLTGVHNRRNFEVLAQRLFNRARRHRKDLSLLLIDADHFKQINDRYGHHVGDQVLQAITRCLEKSLRDYDVLGRIGGEEFAVLLPETGVMDAWQIAQRLCKSCEELQIRNEERHIDVTVSIGLASVEGRSVQTSDLDCLLRDADKALYTAKHGGRNQVCCSAPL